MAHLGFLLFDGTEAIAKMIHPGSLHTGRFLIVAVSGRAAVAPDEFALWAIDSIWW